jgi:hypothetical protein
VYYSGSWGTVCDDSWDIDDGNVVCRELGYGRSMAVYQSARYGQGSGRIWMDDVRCTGSETRLSNCAFNGWGNHDCSHSEDASVVCSLEGRSAEWSVQLQVSPRNTTVSSVYRSIQFVCTVTGYNSNYSIQWVKVIDINTSTPVPGTTNNGVLRVSGTGAEGNYRCILTKSAGGEIFQDAYVYAPPRVYISIFPSRTTIGKNVTIKCRVTQGYPQPIISLNPSCNHCEVARTSNSVVYTVTIARRWRFYCDAWNDFGRSSRSQSLYVMPYVHINASHRVVDIGGIVTISCLSLGYYTPRLSLFVPTGSVYSYGYSSQFHRNIQIGQYASEGGVYRCTSTNTLGTAEDNVTVNGVIPFVLDCP